MKIIYNRLIPFPGFTVITIGKGIFARKEYEKDGLSKYTINHERCHMAQEDDFSVPVLKYILFYIWYGLEGGLKLPTALFGYDPYLSISLEQEAYNHQYDLDYLPKRKKFNGLQYVFKLVK